MTKKEMARIIVASPVWNGTKDADWLVRNNTKDQLKEIFDMLEDAEEAYFDSIY